MNHWQEAHCNTGTHISLGCGSRDHVLVLGRQVRFLSPKTCSCLSQWSSCLRREYCGMASRVGGLEASCMVLDLAQTCPGKTRSCLATSCRYLQPQGEFRTRRKIWEGQQMTDLGSSIANWYTSKQPNLGTRCLARSLEARATQVIGSRQQQGFSLPLLFHADLSFSLKTHFLPGNACISCT